MNHSTGCVCDTCLLALLTSSNKQTQQYGWEAWYTRDSEKLQRYINRRSHILGCPELREDILHDVFIIGFKNIATGKYENQGKSLCAYLYGIARNRIFDVSRLQQKEIPDEAYLALRSSNMISMDDHIYMEKVLILIHEAYNQLTEIYRKVLNGLYTREKTSTELGKELRKSAANIRTMARRAVKTICTYLAKHHNFKISPDAIRLGLRVLYVGQGA